RIPVAQHHVTDGAHAHRSEVGELGMPAGVRELDRRRERGPAVRRTRPADLRRIARPVLPYEVDVAVETFGDMRVEDQVLMNGQRWCQAGDVAAVLQLAGVDHVARVKPAGARGDHLASLGLRTGL